MNYCLLTSLTLIVVHSFYIGQIVCRTILPIWTNFVLTFILICLERPSVPLANSDIYKSLRNNYWCYFSLTFIRCVWCSRYKWQILRSIYFWCKILISRTGQDSSVGRAFACGVIGFPFEPHKCLHRYVEETISAGMLATKRWAGVTPEVNLRESVICTSLPSVNKAAHSGF